MHPQQAAVGIDYLGFSLLLDLPAFLVFGHDQNGNAQHHAFTSAAIVRRGHTLEFYYFQGEVDCTKRQGAPLFLSHLQKAGDRDCDFGMIEF